MKKIASVALLVSAFASACAINSKIESSKNIEDFFQPLTCTEEATNQKGIVYSITPVEYTISIQKKFSAFIKDCSDITVIPQCSQENNKMILHGFYVFDPKYGDKVCCVDLYNKLCECLK